MSVNPDEIDRLLVNELNQLSVNDRERVMEEVHGVFDSNTVSGDHALEEVLAQMQHELDIHYYSTDVHDCGTCATGGPTIGRDAERNIQSNFSTFKSSSIVCDAYREARLKNSSLISDINFLRGMLVAENFNPKYAAHRLILYLQQMKELYGTPDVLFRPIFIDDLDIKAREQLVMGSYQILPDRDSSGRRIFVYLRDICPTVSNIHRVSNCDIAMVSIVIMAKRFILITCWTRLNFLENVYGDAEHSRRFSCILHKNLSKIRMEW